MAVCPITKESQIFTKTNCDPLNSGAPLRLHRKICDSIVINYVPFTTAMNPNPVLQSSFRGTSRTRVCRGRFHGLEIRDPWEIKRKLCSKYQGHTKTEKKCPFNRLRFWITGGHGYLKSADSLTMRLSPAWLAMTLLIFEI